MSTTSEGTPDSIGIFNAPTLRPPRRHAARTTPIAVLAAEKRNRNAVEADAGKGALNRRVLKGSESFHRAGKPGEGAGNHHGVHHIFLTLIPAYCAACWLKPTARNSNPLFVL